MFFALREVAMVDSNSYDLHHVPHASFKEVGCATSCSKPNYSGPVNIIKLKSPARG